MSIKKPISPPRFFSMSHITLPRPILSRQAHRLQVFPIGVTYLPEEAEGDDWDIKMRTERAIPTKGPEFFEPSTISTPADRGTK